MEIPDQTSPFSLFSQWLEEAKATPTIREATAMTVATVNAQGEPSQRVVLLKNWSEQGFVFYTNYLSQKGMDIADNSNVSACFYWDPLFRQVKIMGTAEKTSRMDSEDYWAIRPRESQISQHISRQSQPCQSREILDQEWANAKRELEGKTIPCPTHWGGYLIRPKQIRFWLGQTHRLHDSFRFEKHGSTWTLSRLYP